MGHPRAVPLDPSPAPPAVVLLSGGLDSTTVAAIAGREGYAVHALSFDYGQRHRAELDAARRIARELDVAAHRVVAIDLAAFGGSALTSDLEVPKDREPTKMADDIPITYVPARNTVFLSFALAWAEVLGSTDIFIGVNALDYSGYPDCRPEFIAAFEQLANLATRAGVAGSRLQIHAPLQHLTKAEIATTAIELGIDPSLTVSCYDADDTGAACGHCDACILRRDGFDAAGIADPTRYRSDS